MKLIPPSELYPGLRGRWIRPPSSSSGSEYTISASWASASIYFCFTGTHLALRVGENSERKDKANGGTKMITISKTPDGVDEQTAVLDRGSWTAVDPHPGSDLTIHDEGFVKSLWIRIVLIDWASTFELKGLHVDDNTIIQFAPRVGAYVPRILIIGDSISLAFAAPEGPRGEAVPFGVLDAFPFVAQRRLVQGSEPMLTELEVELRSYPGWLLVSPNVDDIEGKFPAVGMSEAFSWGTPWSREDSPEDLRVHFVIFAIGTNDQFFGISPSRFYDALRDLTAKLVDLSPSLCGVWIIPPFPDCDTANTELVNATPGIVERLQGDFSGLTVKLCDLVKGLGEGDTVDGVHLTLQAHEVLGKRLAKFIEENVA